MIIAFAALSWELNPLRKTAKAEYLQFAKTGIGKDKVRRAVTKMLEQTSFSLAISVGYAGALSAEQRTGDIVLCNETVCMDTGKSILHCSESLIDRFQDRLPSHGIAVRRGRCLTATHLLATGAEKSRVGKNCRCEVVDMEAFWIAELLRGGTVPLVVAKVVLDTLDMQMPVSTKLWATLFHLPILARTHRKAENSFHAIGKALGKSHGDLL